MSLESVQSGELDYARVFLGIKGKTDRIRVRCVRLGEGWVWAEVEAVTFRHFVQACIWFFCNFWV